MKDEKTLGWNPTYFGEPKKGSLAATIADITTKQNDLVGGKPEVKDSVAAQAQKEKEQSEAMKPLKAKHKPGHNDDMKKEDDAEDMRDKNKKDAKGEKHSDPVKIHGETFTKAKEFTVQSMKSALAQVYAEKLDDKDTPDVKDVVKGLKKAQGLHKKQADTLMKQIDDEGNAFGKAVMAAKEKGEKEFVFAGKKYNVEQEMDKVNPVAVKKKFKDRKDKDIDNDGDVDSSDKYLHKRRQAISKAIDK